MERITSWVSDNWPWLASLTAIIGIGYRNEITTQQIKRTVYDKDGDLRLVRILDCHDNIEHCPIKTSVKQEIKHSNEQIAGLREWLIRVEGKLDQVIGARRNHG